MRLGRCDTSGLRGGSSAAPVPPAASLRLSLPRAWSAAEFHPVTLRDGLSGQGVRGTCKLSEKREDFRGGCGPDDLECPCAGIAQAVPGLPRHGDADARHHRRRLASHRRAALTLQDDHRVVIVEEPMRGQCGTRSKRQEPHRERAAGSARFDGDLRCERRRQREDLALTRLQDLRHVHGYASLLLRFATPLLAGAALEPG